MRVEQREPFPIISIPLAEAVRGAVAPVHGGVLATLADVACAMSITGLDLENEFPVSTNLQLQFYGQPREGPLRAEAQAVHRGSRLIGTECVIRDGSGRQIARATASYIVVRDFGGSSVQDVKPKNTD
jgi:uncharacterized protein (TIGR00369 family)